MGNLENVVKGALSAEAVQRLSSVKARQQRQGHSESTITHVLDAGLIGVRAVHAFTTSGAGWGAEWIEDVVGHAAGGSCLSSSRTSSPTPPPHTHHALHCLGFGGVADL